MVLSRKDVLTAALPFKDVACQELGGDVRVTALTAGARNRLALDENGRIDLSELVALTCVDGDGKPLFKDTVDVEKMPFTAVERLAEAALRLNTATSKDARALAGNAPGGSSSGSVSPSGKSTRMSSKKN